MSRVESFRNLAGGVELLDDHESAVLIEDALDLRVEMMWGDDEGARAPSDSLVLVQGRRDAEGAVGVCALTDPFVGITFRGDLTECLVELLDPLVDRPVERLVLGRAAAADLGARDQRQRPDASA